jgi:hypothetical protein
MGRQTEIDLHIHDSTISCTPQPSPESHTEDDADANPAYEIHKILNQRTRDGKKEYKVWFKGYRKTSAQWCLQSDLDADEAVAHYLKNNKPSKTK